MYYKHLNVELLWNLEMNKTAMRKTITLTKEDNRQLSELKTLLGENTSKVIQRAIMFLFNATSSRGKENDGTK